MFWKVAGSYSTYAVGAMRLPTPRTVPSCDTMRGGGGGRLVSTGAVAVVSTAIGSGGAAFVGSVTTGWDSMTGVGVGSVSVEGGGGGGVRAEASRFKYTGAMEC